MPLYDYRCLGSGHYFEMRQRFEEAGAAACPQCQSKSRRVFHSVPVLFKGSGFYSTDHRKGQASAPSNGAKDEEKSEDKPKDKTKEKVAAKAEGKRTGEGSSSEGDKSGS